MNIFVQVSVWTCVFISFGYTGSSGIAGSYSNYRECLRNCQTLVSFLKHRAHYEVCAASVWHCAVASGPEDHCGVSPTMEDGGEKECMLSPGDMQGIFLSHFMPLTMEKHFSSFFL